MCGGRTYHDTITLEKTLDTLDITEMCSGGADGADMLALAYAMDRGIKCTIYPANWKEHGKSAGPIRNNWMYTDFNPELVVAFPGGKGTQNMIEISKKGHTKVLQIP